jgi:DNA invertase Pin-like site-specific DNA recombinase
MEYRMMKEITNPGNKPKISLDQYKQILDLKKSKQGPIKEMTYAFLAKKLGLRASTVINAARKGIKRYDYQLWKEGEL